MRFHAVRLALCLGAVVAAGWLAAPVQPAPLFAVVVVLAAAVVVAAPVLLSLEGLGVLRPWWPSRGLAQEVDEAEERQEVPRRG